ncbi:hypothetical protein AB0B45_30450 [Nonomuraea sp. NPDC049152]|uniref:hypothetical protein n=1 Tax=Nonomuraea sp. NPDC049152 TaxID=3154350 RepID=UPI0033EA7A85
MQIHEVVESLAVVGEVALHPPPRLPSALSPYACQKPDLWRPIYYTYAVRTSREIPVVVLERTS